MATILHCPACGKEWKKQLGMDDYLEGWREWHGDLKCDCGTEAVLSRSSRGEFLWVVFRLPLTNMVES